MYYVTTPLFSGCYKGHSTMFSFVENSPTVLIFAKFIKCIDATQLLNKCQRGAGTDYPSGAYELISGF